MHPHHATANPTALLIVAILAVTFCYVLGCAIFPFTDCGACGGDGKLRSPSGRKFRLCRRCDGTGRRLRVGRLLWNRLHQRDGHGRDGRP
jgi:hypothetical protein